MAQRAVLVGINYYGTGTQLAGCIKRIEAIARGLEDVAALPDEGKHPT